jgi:tRNA wybutosine-synthesizing protein 5
MSNVIDIDQPDLKRFPKFQKAKSMELVLDEGEILFIPALWFHNVRALEPCIAVNVFWKDLDDSFYEKKDLYGNKVWRHVHVQATDFFSLLPFTKDFPIAAKSMKEVENALASLAQLPPYYRNFYARRIIFDIKQAFHL